LICTDEDTAVGVEVTPGQAGDAPQFDGLLDKGLEKVPQAEEVVADKGYDSWDIRERVVEEHDMAAQIPSKSNAVEPWPYDEESYKERNKVERLILKLKQFRAVATRYDKLKDVFKTTVQLALVFIKARSIVNST
jgi:transposase